MITNMGKADRIFRVILGVGILSLLFVPPRTYWGLLGIIPLGTSFLGYCPLYQIFGISTCSIEK